MMGIPDRKLVIGLTIDYEDGAHEVVRFLAGPARYIKQGNYLQDTHGKIVARFINHNISWTEPDDESTQRPEKHLAEESEEGTPEAESG